MPRFAISHHQGGPDGDHYDLFLEADLALKTWRIQKPAFHEPQPAKAIADHRLTYLDYEGDVSGKRGRVAIWDRGLYAIDRWEETHVQVAVSGSKLKTRLRLVKAKDDWTVVDPTLQARQLAAALLRGSALEPAPDKELDPLHASLVGEERRILAAVDRFNKGAPVDWPVQAPDAGLRDRILKARSRWKHPWLDAASAYVEGLEKLAGAVRA
jgi:hypothetical protein